MTNIPDSARPKLCLVTTTPLIIQFFLRQHIEQLSDHFDVTVSFNPVLDSYAADMNMNLPAALHELPIERQAAPMADLVTLLKLLTFFKRERFHLVVTIGPKAGLLGMIAARLAGIPNRIHIFQGEAWARKRGLGRWLFKSLDRLMVRCATQSLVVSHSELAFLRQQKVVKAENAQVLGLGTICGVDTARFREDSNRRARVRQWLGISETANVTLFLGRLNRDKGVCDLVDAFAIAALEDPDLVLLVVGPDEEVLMPQARATLPESVRRRLYYQPYTDQPEKFVVTADLLCLPSYREGFGMVILEAGACGIPSIGSDIYGIQDAIIDGETGILFSAGGVDLLAQAILKLSSDTAYRQRLGAAARRRVLQDFEQSAVVARYVTYFEQLVAERAQS